MEPSDIVPLDGDTLSHPCPWFRLKFVEKLGAPWVKVW
jgi:hypothetical protein